ncbi:unnamed protein product [Peronospora belbahrii]|uniref:Uncharacterized protein n=1 Tax=Peronospora belbahrii TaxID=622444 RepID=A0ABN8CP87_9STRA|nr:unnamed protein product [Peronospora belbahrii]
MGSYRHSIVICFRGQLSRRTTAVKHPAASYWNIILRKKRAIPSNFCYTTCLIGFRQQTSSWVCLVSRMITMSWTIRKANAFQAEYLNHLLLLEID